MAINKNIFKIGDNVFISKKGLKEVEKLIKKCKIKGANEGIISAKSRYKDVYLVKFNNREILFHARLLKRR